MPRPSRSFILFLAILGTTIFTAGGIATGWVPPQRYFAVDFGMRALTFQAGGFNTRGDSNYAGTRAAMLTVRHDFDRLLFAKSRLPGIRKLPFTLSVHGGVFWTDFHDHPPNPGGRAAPDGAARLHGGRVRVGADEVVAYLTRVAFVLPFRTSPLE